MKPSFPTLGTAPPRHDPAAADRTHALAEQAVDHAFRDIVQQQAREDWMRRLCTRTAEALGAVMVMLVRRHAGGTLDIEATSRECALWAEMLRLPERSDGTIAGDGPAARALREGEAQSIDLDDEGLLPWREAARRDGIGLILSVPLENTSSPWVLLVCVADADGAGLVEARVAAQGCARALIAAEEIERDRLLACALRQCGNAAFIAGLEGEIVWCNAAFAHLTGYEPEEVLGRNPRFLNSGRHGVRHYRELWNTIRSGRIWRGETVDRDRSGTAFTALQTITPFGAEGKVTHYLAMYDDITRQTREDVRRQLRVGRDPLTGLMHRAALEAQLSQRLEQGHVVRIARVAARNLRAIEALGPEATERALVAIQSRLSAVVGPACAARLAPGDYLVCLPEDESSARQIMEDLRAELCEPSAEDSTPPDPGWCVAQAHSPDHGTDIDALLRSADRALGIDPMQVACRRLEPIPDSDNRRSST